MYLFRESWRDLLNEQHWQNSIERSKNIDWKNWILVVLHQEQVWYFHNERLHLIQNYKAISWDIQDQENIRASHQGRLTVCYRLQSVEPWAWPPMVTGHEKRNLLTFSSEVKRTNREQVFQIYRQEKQVFQFFETAYANYVLEGSLKDRNSYLFSVMI